MRAGIEQVRIHYHRIPDRKDVFVQDLLLETEAVRVTFARSISFPRPLRIGGRVVLEEGSDAVWFTFPGVWHDIGLFHRADGTFTGTYANILTPPVFETRLLWRTTDLLLDLWLDPDGGLAVLDEDQFEDAVARGWLTEEQTRRARAEVARIRSLYERGAWPPAVVARWSRGRAQEALRQRDRQSGSDSTT